MTWIAIVGLYVVIGVCTSGIVLAISRNTEELANVRKELARRNEGTNHGR